MFASKNTEAKNNTQVTASPNAKSKKTGLKIKSLTSFKKGKSAVIASFSLLTILGVGFLGYQLGNNGSTKEAKAALPNAGFSNFGYGGTCVGQAQCPASATIKYYDGSDVELTKPDNKTNYKADYTIKIGLKDLTVTDTTTFAAGDYKCSFFIKRTGSDATFPATAQFADVAYDATNKICKTTGINRAMMTSSTYLGSGNVLNFDVKVVVQGYTGGVVKPLETYTFNDTYVLKINGVVS